MIGQRHGVHLDRDAALALEVHGVEHLLAHLALGDRARDLEQAVGQRRLAVIDVRDDAEIANVRSPFRYGAGFEIRSRRISRQTKQALADRVADRRPAESSRMTTRNERSRPPIGGMIRRTGASTGSTTIAT